MKFPNLIDNVGGYSFRGFITEKRPGTDDMNWVGTLLSEGVRIARVQYDAGTGDHDIEPVDEAAYEDFLTFAEQWSNDQPGAEPIGRDDAGTQLLGHLADITYHLRRLEVLSRRSATFQLRSDPPERYRFLRNAPLTQDVAAALRSRYGDDLACILREEELAVQAA